MSTIFNDFKSYTLEGMNGLHEARNSIPPASPKKIKGLAAYESHAPTARGLLRGRLAILLTAWGSMDYYVLKQENARFSVRLAGNRFLARRGKPLDLAQFLHFRQRVAPEGLIKGNRG